MGAKIKRFLMTLLDGFISISKGMAALTLFPPNCTFRYEEQFDTDAECLARDWKRIGDDLREVMRRFESDKES